MLKAIKLRLYPTMKQKVVLNKHFGSCRFVYNQALNHKIKLYQDSKTSVSKFDMIKWVTEFRKLQEFSWLQEIKCEVLQNVIDPLDRAFQGFFRGGGFPKFRKKSYSESFLSKQGFKVLENKRLIFFGNKINFKCSSRDSKVLLENKIKQITYSRDNLFQYWASCLIETQEDLTLPKLDKEIGIDLGLKTFLVTSENEVVENPKFYRNTEKKIKKLQRVYSRRIKGSNNKEKARIALAKVHKKVSNRRNNFLHEVSRKLVNENQVIAAETLIVENMIKNHCLAKSIQDVSWSRFMGILEYKSLWYGRELRRIGQWEPSSKTCSCCGWKNKNLELKDRTFICQECGSVKDRDLNAAINILEFSRLNLAKNNSVTSLLHKDIKAIAFNSNREELARINASGQQPKGTGRRKKELIESQEIHFL